MYTREHQCILVFTYGKNILKKWLKFKMDDHLASNCLTEQPADSYRMFKISEFNYFAQEA